MDPKQKLRLVRREEGICQDCPNPVLEGYVVCEIHRAKQVVRNQNRTAKREADGVCVMCSGPRYGNTLRCQECLWYLKERNLLNEYGLSLEDYARMLYVQDRSCAVCKKQETGSKYDWHVDHDHQTGEVRGILCEWCNTKLLMVLEHPSLPLAQTYLDNHNHPSLFSDWNKIWQQAVGG